MYFDEYQALTEKSLNKALTELEVKNYCSIGLAGEVGEVLEVVKKSLYHGHVLNRDSLKKELGDSMWYLARLAAVYGFSLEDIAIANIEKLNERYPNGFTVEESKHSKKQ